MRNSQPKKNNTTEGNIKKIQIAKQHKGKITTTKTTTENHKKNINAAMFSLMIIWMLALLPKKPQLFISFKLSWILCFAFDLLCDQVRNGFCLLAQCCSILQILYH